MKSRNGQSAKSIARTATIAFVVFAVWQVFYHVLFNTILHVHAVVEQIVSLFVETGGALLVTIIVVRGLLRANQELEDLGRQKDTLTGMLVHDLRQPLTALVGGLSTAAKDPSLPQKTRDLIRLAQMGGVELVRMVNNLLDITRMEAGQSPIETAPASPADFITAGVNDVEPLAREKGLDLQLEIADGLPQLNVDSWRLQRVVMNIVGNAIRYTDNGGHVRVKAWADNRSHQLLVSVTDDGLGIPKDFQSKVFDRFAVAATRSSAGHAATGLGLNFCRMIVEAHGGNIWVESEESKGSTFTFSIPITAAV